MSLLKNRISAVVAGSAVIVALGATGAVAGTLITSAQIQDGTIHGRDLNPNLKERALSDSAVTDVEADGPYPGETVLQEGSNSTSKVTAGGGLQTVWVACPEGQVALGGGFTLAADAGKAAAEAVTVQESAPTQVENGAIVYNPVAGDPDGSFLPNAWSVTAANDGASDVVVRPHVICATVAD
jgi:hypothetical protein